MSLLREALQLVLVRMQASPDSKFSGSCVSPHSVTQPTLPRRPAPSRPLLSRVVAPSEVRERGCEPVGQVHKKSRGVELGPDDSVCAKMTDYLEHLFRTGASRSAAARTACAVRARFSIFAGKSGRGLPRAGRALKGFRQVVSVRWPRQDQAPYALETHSGHCCGSRGRAK